MIKGLFNDNVVGVNDVVDDIKEGVGNFLNCQDGS